MLKKCKAKQKKDLPNLASLFKFCLQIYPPPRILQIFWQKSGNTRLPPHMPEEFFGEQAVGGNIK